MDQQGLALELGYIDLSEHGEQVVLSLGSKEDPIGELPGVVHPPTGTIFLPWVSVGWGMTFSRVISWMVTLMRLLGQILPMQVTAVEHPQGLGSRDIHLWLPWVQGRSPVSSAARPSLRCLGVSGVVGGMGLGMWVQDWVLGIQVLAWVSGDSSCWLVRRNRQRCGACRYCLSGCPGIRMSGHPDRPCKGKIHLRNEPGSSGGFRCSGQCRQRTSSWRVPGRAPGDH